MKVRSWIVYIGLLLFAAMGLFVWIHDRDLSAAVTSWATGTIALATVAVAHYGLRQASLLEEQLKMQRGRAETHATSEMLTSRDKLKSVLTLIEEGQELIPGSVAEALAAIGLEPLRSVKESLLLCEPVKGYLKLETALAITRSRFNVGLAMWTLERYEKHETVPDEQSAAVVVENLRNTCGILEDGLKELGVESIP